MTDRMTMPGGEQPPQGPTGPPEAPASRFSSTQVLVAMLAVVAIVGAAFFFLSGDGDDDPVTVADGEIFLQPAASPGPDAFVSDVGALVPGGRIDLAGLLGPSATSTSTSTSVTVAQGVVTTITSVGTEPGLYGGTQDNGRCDREAMIAFLEQDPAKAAAWAAVQGITTADIGTYIRGLTPVTLLADTRVTNHGFRGSTANGFQAVLEAGTAVLVDDTGVPRARCACGNPLLAPEAQTGSATYTGDAWSGFSPERVTVVQPGAPTDELILTDVTDATTFSRPVGSTGTGDVDVVVDTSGAVTATSAPATITTSTTTTTTTTTTTEPRSPVDITASGAVSASSVFSGQFATGLSVDGSAATSWFSAGGGDATYTWTIPQAETIAEVTIVGNAAHSVPDFRTGFGFGAVTVELYNAGQLVGTASAELAGTPDPTVNVSFGIDADEVRLSFTGGEDPTCGGFSELTVVALR